MVGFATVTVAGQNMTLAIRVFATTPQGAPSIAFSPTGPAFLILTQLQ
jgi:hypothetical protein